MSQPHSAKPAGLEKQQQRLRATANYIGLAKPEQDKIGNLLACVATRRKAGKAAIGRPAAEGKNVVPALIYIAYPDLSQEDVSQAFREATGMGSKRPYPTPIREETKILLPVVRECSPDTYERFISHPKIITNTTLSPRSNPRTGEKTRQMIQTAREKRAARKFKREQREQLRREESMRKHRQLLAERERARKTPRERLATKLKVSVRREKITEAAKDIEGFSSFKAGRHKKP